MTLPSVLFVPFLDIDHKSMVGVLARTSCVIADAVLAAGRRIETSNEHFDWNCHSLDYR